MSETSFDRRAGRNWPLILVLAVSVLAVAAGMYKSFTGGGKTAGGETTGAQVNPSLNMTEDQMREVLLASPAPSPPSVHEEKVKAVAGHRARYDANPNDPDAEPLLWAMGNLYKQTGDLQNAAWAYGRYLTRFPKAPGRAMVYMDLAGCYEMLNQTDSLRELYTEMMKDFPPGSNEYKVAEAKLKISNAKMMERDPSVKPPPGPEGSFDIETLPDGTTHYVVGPPKPDEGESAPEEQSGSCRQGRQADPRQGCVHTVYPGHPGSPTKLSGQPAAVVACFHWPDTPFPGFRSSPRKRQPRSGQLPLFVITRPKFARTTAQLLESAGFRKGQLFRRIMDFSPQPLFLFQVKPDHNTNCRIWHKYCLQSKWVL